MGLDQSRPTTTNVTNRNPPPTTEVRDGGDVQDVLETTIRDKLAEIQKLDAQLDALTRAIAAKSNTLLAIEQSETLYRRNARDRIDELERYEREVKTKIDRLAGEYSNLEIKTMRLRAADDDEENSAKHEPTVDLLIDCRNEWERKFVEEKFQISLAGERFKMTTVKKVNNPRLKANFEAKKKRLKDQRDTVVHELLLWRSVSRKNVPIIAAENFQNHGDLFFVRSIRNCDKYFRNGQSKQIYLVKVATTVGGNTSEECARNDFFKKIRVNNDDAYLPMYFVEYRRTGDRKEFCGSKSSLSSLS